MQFENYKNLENMAWILQIFLKNNLSTKLVFQLHKYKRQIQFNATFKQ